MPKPNGHHAHAADVVRQLPDNLDAERFVLGAILCDSSAFELAAGALSIQDFAIEKHKRIFGRMRELNERGEAIDRVTLANELAKHGQLQSVDGLSYLVSLDDGLPQIHHLDRYVGIVKEKADLRRIIQIADTIQRRAYFEDGSAAEILTGATEQLGHLFEEINSNGEKPLSSIGDLPSMRSYASQKIDWVVDGLIAAGTVTLISGESGGGKSTVTSAICSAIDRGVPFAGFPTQRRPVAVFDRENPLSVVVERFDRTEIDDSPTFKYWGGWAPEEPPPPFAPVVIDWVKACYAKPVMVWDSLVSFSSADENDATEMRSYMQGFRRLADMGATVIILHHSGKADSAKDYRGSSDIKASVDVGYHLANLGDSSQLGTIRLRSFKGRFSVIPEVVLFYSSGHFRADARGPVLTVTETLKDLLIAHPRSGVIEIEDAATSKGIARGRVRQFIADRIVSGDIRVDKGQRNTRFHTWVGDTDRCS